MLSKSFTGTIRDTVFEQAQNLPTDEYGITLFQLFTSFTVVAYLQISIFPFNKITSLLSLTYNYVILTINTKLTHIFLLACIPTHILDNSEHIQHMLTMYGPIK